MTIKIKKLNPNTPLPKKAHPSDYCYDCVAVSEEEIAPNVWKYGLGFALELLPETSVYPIDHYTFSIDARPRSSVWKTGMVLANCVGTIDEDYRGELCAIFYHVLPNMPRYKVGDKIIQIKLGEAEELRFEEVDNLSDTDRGAGGFGSTGI